jgi:hypothetical protein
LWLIAPYFAGIQKGSDAVKCAGETEAAHAGETERWREISVSTDFDAAGSLPDLKFGKTGGIEESNQQKTRTSH